MIVFSVVFIGFLIAHKCDHLFGSLLPSVIYSWDFVSSTYIIQGTDCPPPFSMWWWSMLVIGSWCSTASAVWSWRYGAKWEGRGWFRGDNFQGVGVAAYDEEACHEREFWHWLCSLWIGNFRMRLHHEQGGGIPEGEPAWGRCRSSGGNNCRRHFRQRAKEKIISRHGRGVLLLLLRSLVSEDGAGDTVDVGGGGLAKGKSADPPGIGRRQ